MKRMKPRLLWLTGLIAALAMSGCVKVDQQLTLEKDGSGVLDMRYGMSEQTISQIEAMQKMAESMGEDAAADESNEPPFDFDEEQVRADFEADHPEGVELVSLESETVDGWKYMKLKLKFDNLASLKETEFFSDGELSLTKDENGNYILTQSTGAADAMPSSPSSDAEAAAAGMMEQMASMFAGMRIATTVIAPTEVLESNATKTDGHSASWIFDVDEDPTVLTKLQKINMRMVFDGKGVDIAEF